MQTEARPNTNLSYLDDSDQQALGLFNNLCPDQQPQQPSHHSQEMQEDDSRPLGRLTKLKKQSKKLKKKLKRKQRKMEKQRKMKQLIQRGEALEIATPQKKLKKMKRQGKDRESGNQSVLSQQAGSSEFSSESQNEDDIQKQLRNLNPDDAEENPTPNRRLKKSNRKSKIEEKQGFCIDELGNQAEAKTERLKKYYDDEQDYSFDDVNKKGRKRKPKVSVPTNEQIMSNLKEHGGVVQEEGPQVQGNYDNGLDMLYSMKDKRKGAIKVNNKLFSNLDFDTHNEQVQMPPPQNLQLQLKPKTSNHSSSRFTFLSKVETLKKQRGLQANIDVQAYEKKIQERAKQSMAKAVNVMSQQQFQDQIDLQVRVPTIARGKSADIINNTVFLKSFVRHKSELPESPMKQPTPVKQIPKKQGISRRQFYKQIQEQTRLRRSKYISQQQLKNSFKKTNLGQLEQARKRIQQKRRKQALSQNSQQEQNGELDSKQDKIEEMIQIEQRICGDIQEEDDANQQWQKANVGQEVQGKKLQQAKFTINLQQQQLNAEEKQQQLQQEEEQDQRQNQFDQLASASQHPQPEEEDQPEQEEQQQPEEQQEQQASEYPRQQQPKESMQVQQMAEFKEEDRKQMMELEQEGIMLRKRKLADMQPSITQQQSVIQNELVPTITPKGKQLAEQQTEEFTNFRKLRKIAMVIAQKKKIREQGRKYASQFIEQQAEEGSDNQEHDDMIKNIDYKAEEKEYEGVDLDADLVELIDNAVDINQEDQYEAFRKYLQDIRLKDREEIKKIIRGQFRSRHDDLELEVEQDERKRQERMEEVMNWMKKREEEEGEGIYLKSPQKEENEGDDSDSQMSWKKRKEAEVVQEESQQIPEEQQKAMIQRFIENTLPSSKKQYRPMKVFDLGPLPQSVKLQKSNSNKTISLTKLGSKNSGQAKSAKVKKTSSLINQILNRNSISKISQKTLTGKLAKK